MIEMIHPLLSKFKLRMRIFHDAEDENLSSILKNSEIAITRMCGVPDEELILERSRYVYNDKLEKFYTNFRNEVANLNLDLYDPDEEMEVEDAEGNS